MQEYKPPADSQIFHLRVANIRGARASLVIKLSDLWGLHRIFLLQVENIANSLLYPRKGAHPFLEGNRLGRQG